MSDLKDTIELSVDASGVETGVGRARHSLESLGNAASSAGEKAATGFNKFGEGGKAAADKIERDTRRMVQQIERVSAEMEAGGRNTANYFEARARQMGLATEQIQPYIDKLRASEAAQLAAAKGMQGTAMSAGQLGAAMRSLPAQIQDVVVSLQGGQRPMTVLLQQGSQITTQFGGISAALQGVATYALGLVNPFTLAAAAIGTVGGVVYLANSQMDALRDKVDAAGRTIGYTTGELYAMAGALNTGWSQSANATALAEIASSAALSGDELKKFTTLAVDLERTAGKPVADTAKLFRELGEAPADAVKKLAKETDFLTAAQYEQIKALEEQGRKTDAARVAMGAYADGVKPAVDRAKANLGALGTALDYWRQKALDMWAAVAGAARAATGNQTGEERAADAQRRINEINSGLPFKSAGFVDRVRGMFNPDGVRQELLTKAQEELAYINQVNAAAAQNAKFEQQREARAEAARDAIDAVGKAFDGALTKGQRMNKELTEFRANLDKIRAANPDSAFLDPKRIAAAEAAIRDRYKDSSGGSKRTAAAPGENEVARIKALIAEEQAYTKALQERGAEATKMTAGEKLVMQIQEQLSTSIKGVARSNKEAALAEAQKLVQAEKARQVEERRAKALQEAREANERLVADTWKTADGIEKQAAELDAANSMWGKGKVAVEEYRLAQAKEMLAMADASDSFIPEYVKSLQAIVDARKHMVDATKDQAFKQLNQEIQEWSRQAEERARLYADEQQLSGLTALERAKITAAREVELKLTREIDRINKSGLDDAKKQALITEATAAAAKDKSAAVARVVQEDWARTSDQINQSLTDALLRGFESGKDFAKNFRDTLLNMFKTLVLRPVISFIVNPIGNAISGIVSGFLGGGQGGGGGGLMGTASNMQSAYQWLSGGYQDTFRNVANFFGFGGSAAAPAVGYGGQALTGLTWGGKPIASSTVTGFSGAPLSQSSWLSSAATGLAVVAAPLIIGALAEGATRDRFSGAAFATSNWAKDPTVTIGGAEYDPIKGILPDREALVGRALEAGISQEIIDRFKDKDRALLHYIRMLDSSRQSGNEGPPINVNALLENDNMYAADWYRGQGYTHPQAMGWWNDKGYDLASNDPAITTASRAVATSIVAPLTEINRILGGAADDFRVTAGYATRGGGKGVWAGLNVSQGENNLVDWVNMDDFHSPQEAVKGMYEQALGALEKLDLPKWAQEQVDGAQAAMSGLKGDKMGEEAAALYAQTAGSIAQTISAIKMLIDVFPDFAGQTQDTVHAIATDMGGLQNLTTAYNSYLEGFYSEEERRALAMKQLGAQFADLGVALPDSRDAFRALVESQDLSTEAGQKMFAALMALNGAFAQLTETAPAAQSAADLLRRQNELLADQARLQADLMAASGDTTGADAARRALDTEGYSDAELAIYDANRTLSEQIELEKQRLDLLRQQQSIQADLMEAAGDIEGAQALRRELATVGFSEAALAIYDANQALRDQIAALQQFSGIVGGIGNSLASLIQDGLLGNLSAADLGGRMADVVIGGVYNAMAGGVSQQITSLLMNGLVTPMVQAALVGTSVSEAVSSAAIDKMMAQATAVAQALGAVLSDPAFRAAMAQVEGIMSGLAASIAPAQPYYTNWDTQRQQAQQAAQEAQRLADQQAQEAQRLAQQAAQEAQRAADEEARRQQGIMNERMGLTKQLLQLEGNTVLLRQIELEALDPSNRALQQRIWAIEDETAAAEKYKSALKDAQDFLGGFTKNIEEFIFKVSHAQADAQQSYQMAAAKFTAQMTLARGGDRDAMNGITGYADTLIGSIRRESTTGAEANLRIARVLGQLASLPKQVSAEQLIVDAIVNANTSLEKVLSTNFASLDANVDGLLTAGELAASGLATNTQISALMARVDANGDGMISKQELANSRLQTLFTEQCTTNTNLGNVTSAQNSTNSWLSQIQLADVGYSLSNVNAINAGASATVAAIKKTNADLGVALVRDYNQAPVVAQFSSDSPLFSIFAAINETNAWLYHIHGLETANIRFWEAMLNRSAPVTVRSENRTPANGTVFADGGYTGPGAKWEPAGVVHKGEVVWSQADVARWGGPGIVDALRQGAPGYADGGPVAVRVPQIYVPPVGRSNEETQALLREVLAELRAQRSDDRARHNSLAEPLQRMDRRGAKWDRDGLPAERTNEAIA